MFNRRLMAEKLLSGFRLWNPLVRIAFVVALFVACGTAAFAHAIGGIPDMMLNVDIRDHEVTCSLQSFLPIFADEFGTEIATPTVARRSASRELEQRVKDIFYEKAFFKIDGIAVKPLVRSFGFTYLPNFAKPDLPGFWIGKCDLAFITNAPPHQVAMKMSFHEPTPSDLVSTRNDKAIQAALNLSAEGQTRPFQLSWQEPEYVWHSLKNVSKPVIVKSREENGHLHVPTGFAVAIFFGALTIVLRWNRRLEGRWLWLSLSTGIILSFLTAISPLSSIELPSPFRAPSPTVSATEAVEIFSSLHRNVYRAFDYPNESDIYDTLAASVDGKLLNWIYNEIYESLILRNEGGAVCQIQSVLIQAADLLENDVKLVDAAFRIRCSWRVRGVVKHWGHVHVRDNRYEGIFSIAPRDGAWKIVDVEILDQQQDAPATPTFGLAQGITPETIASAGGATTASAGVEANPVASIVTIASIATMTTIATIPAAVISGVDSGNAPESSVTQSSSSTLGAAENAYRANDFEKAFSMFSKLAESGDPVAQLRLANLYYRGEGTEKDEQTGASWLRKAAEGGVSEARCALGAFSLTGEGVPESASEAVFWFRLSAEQGNLQAMNELRKLLLSKNAATRDVPEGMRWLHAAAERGDPDAQLNLGLLLYLGEGVEKDLVSAVALFRQAALQNDARAQFSLGVAYDHGEGVAVDKSEALSWYKKAAEQGYPIAMFNLGQMYGTGDGVTKDENEAFQWFLKAAKTGNTKAQYSVALRFALGKGTPQSASEAAHWFQVSAEHGCVEAQYNLGCLYEQGQGVPKDPGNALKWFLKASESGDADAQAKLGGFYYDGSGVEKDAIEALRWYRKAAEQGSGAAKRFLETHAASGLPGGGR
ncbi:MAG: SEL1-like repeat protein [Candidatus Riflebacteria bacterium]|nr:SEL1-like repeat protein [Candidatus Riflebacteria bacterium]